MNPFWSLVLFPCLLSFYLFLFSFFGRPHKLIKDQPQSGTSCLWDKRPKRKENRFLSLFSSSLILAPYPLSLISYLFSFISYFIQLMDPSCPVPLISLFLSLYGSIILDEMSFSCSFFPLSLSLGGDRKVREA